MIETLNKEIAEYIKGKFLYDGELYNDLSLTEAGVLDSMGVISLVTHIESQYNIVVEDEEINQANLGSIEKISFFIQTKFNR